MHLYFILIASKISLAYQSTPMATSKEIIVPPVRGSDFITREENTYVPKPGNEEEKLAIWKSQVLIPLHIHD